MKTIEFDYETIDNRILTVLGSENDNKIHFKLRDETTGKKISIGTLSSFDIQNIEDLIV